MKVMICIIALLLVPTSPVHAGIKYFAKIDPMNKEVLWVIVASQEFINSGVMGNKKNWVSTDYNTKGGIHYDNNGKSDRKPQLRKNYAGIGMIYDVGRDAFRNKKPYTSWILNEDSCLWKAPILMPNDGNRYYWDEDTLSWKEKQ